MSDLDGLKWLVVYTKPRNEKVVAERIEQLGVESYCPLRRSKNRWSDRWKWVEKPLFTSYCFVRINPSKRDILHSIPGLVRFLFWNGSPAIVQDAEIEKLKTWLHDLDHESIEVLTFAPGERVLVGSGPLMDLKGSVEGKSGNYLYLRLESLGSVVRVDLRKNKLQKV